MYRKSLIVVTLLTMSLLYAPPTTRLKTRATLAAAKKKADTRKRTEVRPCFEEKAKEDEKWVLTRTLSEYLKEKPFEGSIIGMVQELRPHLSRGRRNRFLLLGVSILKQKAIEFLLKRDEPDQNVHEKLNRVARYQTLSENSTPKTREGVKIQGEWFSNFDPTIKVTLEPVCIVGQTGEPNKPFKAELRVEAEEHVESLGITGNTRDMLHLLDGAKINGKLWKFNKGS